MAGVATIITEVGEGEYTARLKYETGQMEAAISTLEAQSAALDSKITDAETEKNTAESARNTAESELNAAIAVYSVDPTDANAAIVNEKVIALSIASSQYNTAVSVLSGLQARQLSVDKEVERLQGLVDDEPETKTAWVVDYTMELTGEVDVIEIAGDSDNFVIAPGGVSTDDGSFIPMGSQNAPATVFNWALKPWWIKYKPHYRVGEITDIDYDAGTADIDLDPVTYAGKSLNQAESLSGVEFEYMTCNSDAFEIGNRVIIKFTDQDWGQPVVIGFETQPKVCTDLFYADKQNLYQCSGFSTTVIASWYLPSSIGISSPFNQADSKNNKLIKVFQERIGGLLYIYLKLYQLPALTLLATIDIQLGDTWPYGPHIHEMAAWDEDMNMVRTWSRYMDKFARKYSGFSTDLIDSFDENIAGEFGWTGGMNIVGGNFCTATECFNDDGTFYKLEEHNGFSSSKLTSFSFELNEDSFVGLDRIKSFDLAFNLLNSNPAQEIRWCDGFSLTPKATVSLTKPGFGYWEFFIGD